MHIDQRICPLALILLAGVLFSGGLAAQETRPDIPAPVRLSPNEAVDRAIKNNLSLESARISSSTKKRASDLSWNQFIPSVDVGGALLRLNEAPQGMTIPLPDILGGPVSIPAGSQWRLAGSISVALNFNVSMFEEMKRLRLDYGKGLISYEKARAQLERDVRKAYNNMVLLQENINLLKENFEAAGRRVQMAQANYRAGLAPELTLLQAQVAMENMKPMIDQAENGYRLSMAQFAMFLGLPYNTLFELVSVEGAVFIPLDLSDLISKAVSGKPDIRELKQDILSLNSLRKSTILRLYTPTLSLSWNADPAFSKDPLKDPWFEDVDNWKQQSGNFRIALGFRLNGLLPFGTEYQGVRSINDNIRIANTGLAQMIYGTEIEVYNTVLSLDKTRISAEAQAQTVNLAERAYRLTEQAYSAGLQDLLQVQNAELELKQAKVSMLEQHFNYLNGLIDLEYSIGVPYGTLSSGTPVLKGE
jgi:outer membrane protein TolC